MSAFAEPVRRRLGVRTAITVLVFLVASFLGAGLTWLLAQRLEREFRAENGQINLVKASNLAAVIDAEIASFGRETQARADALAATDPARRVEAARAMIDALAAVPAYAWVGYTDAEGTVLAATGSRLVGVRVSHRDWWSGAQNGLYFGDVHEAKLLARLMPALAGGEPWRFVDIAVPVHGPGGTLVGVLGVHLSWPWLRGRIDLFAGTPGTLGGEVFIVGPDGRLRYGAQGRMGDGLTPASLVPPGSSWALSAWPDQQRYVTARADSGGAAGFPGFGWTTLVRTPVDQGDSFQATALRSIGLAALLAVGLATALAWLLATLYTRPLRQFVDALAHLGDKDRALPTPPRLLPLELASMHEVVLALVQRLQAEQARQRAAFENVGRSIPGVLVTRVHRGNEVYFTHISESARLYFGLDPATIRADHTGFAWMRHVHPEDQARVRALLSESARTGRLVTFAYRVQGGDGRWRTLQSSVVPRDSASSEERVFDVLILDISELAEARAEAQRASAAKDRFLATMSHELRTPLNGIIGFAQLLEGQLPDPEQRRQAGYIRQTGQTLTRILNDILDHAKIESGRLDLERQPFDLGEVLDGCRGLFAVAAAEKGLGFEFHRPPQLPTLLGDPTRLRQVLSNLLSNALKFTSAGGVRLALELHAGATAQQVDACFEVRDSGIGMSPEQLANAFEPFRQADASTTRRFGGTGLGLSICRRLVEAMGGRIEARSTEGQGTTVQVCIPFTVVSPATQAGGAAEAPAPVQAGEGRALQVLVVDDVELNRIVLRAMLERRGHQVEEADNGVAAVDRVRRGGLDLVLMDVEMPDMDGLEATRRIRALDGDAGRVPVWAVTGHAFAEDLARIRAAGMEGGLTKPVDFGALVTVLQGVATAGPA